MKKVFLVLLISIFSVSLFSQEINLGDFPVGKWEDKNWDAVWEFSSDNIRILDLQGNVYYDFKQSSVTYFKIDAVATGGLKLSFRCDDTNKDYHFLKDLTSLNLKMTIDTDEGLHYEVELASKM